MQYLFQDTAALAAAGNIQPLTGDPVSQPPFNAFVQMGINGSAAGLRAGVYVGGLSAFDNLAVNALNRFPVVPDDLIVTNGVCPRGAFNRVRITNPTAGALTWFLYVKAGLAPMNV